MGSSLMSNAIWHVGDTREVLRTLPDNSVDLVMTSPPFLALRSYLPADHPDKALEIGSEGTPGAFMDVLLDVTEELARVLAPHGSLVVELGDTYSGSGASGWERDVGEYRRETRSARSAEGALQGSRELGNGWPLPKSLCMIPSSYAWALAYGRNPWTGRATDPWRVRNLIAWCRPNPPVGALGDKFRPGTSYLTVACKSGSRYFDLDAVREPHLDHRPRGGGKGLESWSNKTNPRHGWGTNQTEAGNNPAGAPPLDWWEIPTQPYAGSHYATFPSALCVRPVKAMCPQKVCRVCGMPSRRITRSTRFVNGKIVTGAFNDHSQDAVAGMSARDGDPSSGLNTFVERETLGWTECDCVAYCPNPRCHDDPNGQCHVCRNTGRVDKWRNGVVLDPFAGSGTTLEVATGHGRDAIGIDLDPSNLDLARQRVGMFLQEGVPDAGAAA
jgi:hypothetical protein